MLGASSSRTGLTRRRKGKPHSQDEMWFTGMGCTAKAISDAGAMRNVDAAFCTQETANRGRDEWIAPPGDGAVNNHLRPAERGPRTESMARASASPPTVYIWGDFSDCLSD